MLLVLLYLIHSVLFAAPATRKQPAPAPGLPDILGELAPSAIHLGGWLGQRAEANAVNRLAKVDLEPLLEGFRRKPGVHPWIGEHIGKWMHAATLAWASTGNAELRRKLDFAAAQLAQAQEPDGYLGTYLPGQRFGLFPDADWDVWSHKYCLIGLLTYHHYTGDKRSLATSRKAGDLLVRTFGPGGRSILSAGTHVGMAATSVLEPMVLLHRATGDARYLEFCHYVVRSWDEPGGPRIMAALREHGQVNKTANGKAYEMLSNLVGLCELARDTGDPAFLEPALKAWNDIVKNRLYLTGSASQGEHFQHEHHLPNEASANVAETCVTTTWIQLNRQLLRLTGEVRFAEQLERTFYNHLAAAQRPDGAEWCYFTPLDGRKPYGPGINCCVSSGPRGMALVPASAAFRFGPKADDPEGILLPFLETVEVKTKTSRGTPVTITIESGFPIRGEATVRVTMAKPAPFAVRLRVPSWAEPRNLSFRGGLDGRIKATREGWITLIADDWKGATATLKFHLATKVLAGQHGNTGRSALSYGPFVLAYDQRLNPDSDPPPLVGLADAKAAQGLRSQAESLTNLQFRVPVRTARRPEPGTAVFVPFADAGATGGRFAVWLRAPGEPFPRSASLFAFATEERSRRGNVDGSIADGDPASYAVTFDGQPQAEAWFSVQAEAPVTAVRVAFAHGKSFHDGGWFDTSGGQPRLEFKRHTTAAWEPLGLLEDYPATTATDGSGLKDGQRFTFKLTAPTEMVALRILGKPAHGDNPAQAFASCAELQALRD